MRKREPKGINRREFLGAAAAGALAAGATKTVNAQKKTASTRVTAQPHAPSSPPNILFILADDLGWGDLSCYGRPDYRTPNLDRLASEGTRFTDAYSASPVCTPTRCAFITGRYPWRTPVGFEEPLTTKRWLEERKRDIGLPPEHPTVASLLKAAGYRTALVGKWHLGYLPKYSPVKSGFDEFFGIMSGGADYFSHLDTSGDLDLYEAETPVERIGYTTDLLTERAVEFLSRRHDRPFYLSLHYTAPHWPWEGPRDAEVSRKLGREHSPFTSGGSLKVYADMIGSLDDGVGRVMRALSAARLDRQTLVVFTSDNGGERFSYNWPFQGRKLQLYEGGIRVPAFARMPGTIPAGRTTGQIAVTFDWTATFVAAAGARPHPDYPLDGEDLMPVLRGARAAFERTVFWGYAAQGAARAGRWKYLRLDEKTERLFDLATDETENADFSRTQPEVFERLRAAHQHWESQMLKRPPRA